MTTETPEAPRKLRFEVTTKQRVLFDAFKATPDGGMLLAGYGGAAGGGKSKLIAELFLSFARSCPGVNLLIGRKQLTNLKTTTMREFDRAAVASGALVHSNKQENWRAIRDPKLPESVPVSMVYFRGVDDYLSLGSEQYGGIGLDEAGEIAEASANMLITRLRDPAASKYLFLAASNPWPGWFERWFVKRELPAELLAEFDARVIFVPARIHDNPHLKPSPAAYEARLRAILPSDWVDRLVAGSFGVFEGQVYPEFSPYLHLWRGELPELGPLTGGIDFGKQSPFGHLTAGIVSGEIAKRCSCGQRRSIRFSEFGERHSKAHDALIAWMKSVETLMNKPVRWRADQSQGMAITMLQRAFRVRLSHGGAGSVFTGIGIVRRRLALGPVCSEPHSYYTEDCPKWKDGMLKYRWATPPNPDTTIPGVPMKVDDDLVDADRYRSEEEDGFPVAEEVPTVTTVSGRPRPRKAV